MCWYLKEKFSSGTKRVRFPLNLTVHKHTYTYRQNLWFTLPFAVLSKKKLTNTKKEIEEDAYRLVTSKKNSEFPESLWLSGRASERGIRKSEVRFLRIFSLSHARDKTIKIFPYVSTELKTYHLSYPI